MCEVVNVNKCEILIFVKIEMEWLKFSFIKIKVMGPCEDESMNTQIMENLFPYVGSKWQSRKKFKMKANIHTIGDKK